MARITKAGVTAAAKPYTSDSLPSDPLQADPHTQYAGNVTEELDFKSSISSQKRKFGHIQSTHDLSLLDPASYADDSEAEDDQHTPDEERASRARSYSYQNNSKRGRHGRSPSKTRTASSTVETSHKDGQNQYKISSKIENPAEMMARIHEAEQKLKMQTHDLRHARDDSSAMAMSTPISAESPLSPRSSKFIEASMHDRISAIPPMQFIGDEDALERYLLENAATPTTLPKNSSTSYRIQNSSTAPDLASPRSSGLYRFGKAIASAFNPFGIFGSENDDGAQKSAEAAVLRERQQKAAQAYAELVKTGFKGTKQTDGFALGEDVDSTRTAPDPGQRDCNTRHAASDYISLAEAVSEGPTISSQASASPTKPSLFHRASYHAMTLSKLEGEQLSDRNGQHSSVKSSFLRPSLHNLRKSKSGLHTSRLPTSEVRSQDPSSYLSPPNTTLHTQPMRTRPSKRDLQKQARLTKKISNLEEQLDRAKRKLDDVLGGDVPPVPALPSGFNGMKAAAAQQQSELMIVGEQSSDVRGEEAQDEDSEAQEESQQTREEHSMDDVMDENAAGDGDTEIEGGLQQSKIDEPPDNADHRLFLGNIDANVNEEYLEERFAGSSFNIRISAVHRVDGYRADYAILEAASKTEADGFARTFNGQRCKRCKMRIYNMGGLSIAGKGRMIHIQNVPRDQAAALKLQEILKCLKVESFSLLCDDTKFNGGALAQFATAQIASDILIFLSSGATRMPDLTAQIVNSDQLIDVWTRDNVVTVFPIAVPPLPSPVVEKAELQPPKTRSKRKSGDLEILDTEIDDDISATAQSGNTSKKRCASDGSEEITVGLMPRDLQSNNTSASEQLIAQLETEILDRESSGKPTDDYKSPRTTPMSPIPEDRASPLKVNRSITHSGSHTNISHRSDFDPPRVLGRPLSPVRSYGSLNNIPPKSSMRPIKSARDLLGLIHRDEDEKKTSPLDLTPALVLPAPSQAQSPSPKQRKTGGNSGNGNRSTRDPGIPPVPPLPAEFASLNKNKSVTGLVKEEKERLLSPAVGKENRVDNIKSKKDLPVGSPKAGLKEFEWPEDCF